MLHPSYNDLMNVINGDIEPGEQPVVSSRYSIVLAAAKRARQLIDGSEPLVRAKSEKPLSTAIEEMSESAIKIETATEGQVRKENLIKKREEEAILAASEESESVEEDSDGE